MVKVGHLISLPVVEWNVSLADNGGTSPCTISMGGGDGGLEVIVSCNHCGRWWYQVAVTLVMFVFFRPTSQTVLEFFRGTQVPYHRYDIYTSTAGVVYLVLGTFRTLKNPQGSTVQ